ncbi:MAG: LolA family protein [Myxococcaceae bacterium]
MTLDVDASFRLRCHPMGTLALLFLGLAGAPDAGWAAGAQSSQPTAEVKALVDRMQAFYERTQDFTADFRQDYAYKSFNRTVHSTGTVAFKKPAQMRWDYLTPAVRSFVLSGEKVYAWDPAAQTLTRGELPSSHLSSSVTFLWGRGRLLEEFTIVRAPCGDCQGVLLVLTPRKTDARFRELRLELDPKTAQVRRSVVVDPDGSENAIAFTNFRTNTGLNKERFVLDVPAGTQVLDASAPPHP